MAMINKNTKTSKSSGDKNELALFMNDRTPFHVHEAVNHLCINIMSLETAGKSKTFVITSAGVREGKTIISASVARNLAKLNDNSRVLYIDADLRSAGISTYIAESKGTQEGLSEYLSEKSDEPNIVSTDLENFDIFCSGAKMKNPISLLASPKMKSMLNKFKEEYDYIIFDSSPVGIVKDALLLANYVDGYILSVRADSSKTTTVNDAIDSIKDVNGKVVGVVLNSVATKVRSKKHREEAEEIARIYSAE